MSAPITYKDFEKESRDVLTKYTSASGKWKVEHKYKAGKDSFVVNPVCTNDGKVTVEVEGQATAYGVNYKVLFSPEDLQGIKTTLGYTYLGQKLELTVARKKDNQHDLELAQSGLAALGPVGVVHLNNKLLRNGQELESSAAACVSGVQVGYDAAVDLQNFKLQRWSASAMARLAGGRHVVVRTNQLADYVVGGSAVVPLHPAFAPRVAAFVRYTPKQQELECEGGLEVPCPIVPGNSLKVRVSKQAEWALTYIAALPNRWTLGLSLDKNMKTGLVLSQS